MLWGRQGSCMRQFKLQHSAESFTLWASHYYLWYSLAKGKGVSWSIASGGEGSELEWVGALLAHLCLLSPSSFPPSFSSTDAERDKTCEVCRTYRPYLVYHKLLNIATGELQYFIIHVYILSKSTANLLICPFCLFVLLCMFFCKPVSFASKKTPAPF